MAIAQTTYTTDSSSGIQALRQLLEAVKLYGDGAGGRAAFQPSFSTTSPSATLTS
jgi:hypothetical protein